MSPAATTGRTPSRLDEAVLAPVGLPRPRRPGGARDGDPRARREPAQRRDHGALAHARRAGQHGQPGRRAGRTRGGHSRETTVTTVGGMRFRHLGDSGLVVSVVGLGTNNLGMKLDLEQSRAVVHAALDAGITLFDTADSYGDVRGASRRAVGRASRRRRAGHQVRGRRPATRQRQRRGLGRAGLAPLHRAGGGVVAAPAADRLDRSVPAAPSRPRHADARRRSPRSTTWCGPARSATSARRTWPAGRWPTRSGLARTHGWHRFVSAQNEYNWLDRGIETELVPALEQYGIGLLPVLPAGLRPADRQVPPRRGGPGRQPHRGVGHARHADRRRPSTGSRP